MKFPVRTIGLILLATYPLGLSAQDLADPRRTASADDVRPAVYQQPAVSAEKAAIAAEPRQVPQAAEIPPTANNGSLPPLKPRAPASHAPADKPLGGVRSLITLGGSLTAVLGLFFLMVWMVRRASPHGAGTLPPEAFETLGRAALASHQQVHLLRCGNKLLLVSVTPSGAETLTEITDPAEVGRLVGLCRRSRSGGAAATFRQALRQAEDRNG
jgi:flagellar biogenesis protein FliO